MGQPHLRARQVPYNTCGMLRAHNPKQVSPCVTPIHDNVPSFLPRLSAHWAARCCLPSVRSLNPVCDSRHVRYVSVTSVTCRLHRHVSVTSVTPCTHRVTPP